MMAPAAVGGGEQRPAAAAARPVEVRSQPAYAGLGICNCRGRTPPPRRRAGAPRFCRHARRGAATPLLTAPRLAPPPPTAAPPPAARTPPAAQDEDLALAKVLQEQERAFFSLAYGAAAAAGAAPAAAAAAPAPLAPRRLQPTPLGAAAAPPNAPPPAAPALEAPPLSDEELAWQLMREEEAGLQARMLALAGVGAAGALGGAAGAAGDGGTPGGSDGDAASAEDPDAMTYERLSALGEVAGVVPTGLPAAARAALPAAPYAGAEGEQCAVCRFEFEEGEEVAALPCRHVFHAPCVCRWLEGKRTCPTCNREVALEPAAAAR
jgi:hypothetical protein